MQYVLSPLPLNEDSYVREITKSLMENDVNQHTKLTLEKLAKNKYGIFDKTDVKELTELSIVLTARSLAHTTGTLRDRYDKIVNLYYRQVNLSHRTSQSILLQQYSTPAPISYLMGVFCGLDRLSSNGGLAFEPSAGNGLLTIAADPGRVYVNEIDERRRDNLKSQGFANVWSRDASKPFWDIAKTFQAVLTNPPFGALDKAVYFDDYKITMLEHLMCIYSLQTLSDAGKAAIVIGGHTEWDDRGRIRAGRNRIFFNYLYSRYYVADVINIDGHKLYSRQGTSFDVRLILINGRKTNPSGFAPLRNKSDYIVQTFDDLFDRIMLSMKTDNNNVKHSPNTHKSKIQLESEAMRLLHKLRSSFPPGDLGAPYVPASQACVVLDTQVPDSMAFETQSAIDKIRQEVGGDMDNFVRHRLGYDTKVELCRALSAEQIDAVGIAIYNIEARSQGMIIGDQTGIGKGRVAASVIRYAVQQGLKPVFLTEKANLFSDIYRDLVAIGSGHLRPFIINAKESKTDIKDEDGNVIYQALEPELQKGVLLADQLPSIYDFVVATYSQFNSADKKPEKPNFLRRLSEDNIFIMDEAHNSSGASNTGIFMQSVVSQTRGVVFLSATFAKRPDNMPIYAMKTSIADCTMTKEALVEAITRGGVALQEVLSAQLVSEGQMLRRERSFEGVEVNYIPLSDMAEEHKAVSDNITQILRDIIAFQKTYVDKQIEVLDEIAAAEGKETTLREGTSQAGVDNLPYFSKVFQVINQMLFSLKADAVAERAITRLKEGKKTVIAFASTMGSFIETVETDAGLPVADGDTINADFSEVLLRGLDGVLRYTEKDVTGKSIYKKFSVVDLGQAAVNEYRRISDRITSVSTGITISPIDVIIQRLNSEGYNVAEVTGRKYELQLNRKTGMGIISSRKRINVNDAFRRFNNNEIDVLMINQSGSTGASAHAIPTAKVSKENVRQRVMIVLQAELDISTEVQKRGRINRTGQILKPVYDYLISSIPAEQRLMMILQKKLKSLDANTTSNQKQSTKILDVPDFLNKYGDKVVKEHLIEHPEINILLDDPLKLRSAGEDGDFYNPTHSEDAAMRVSGRVAVLSTKMQADFYNEISQRYNDYVEYLKQVGEYDLEVEAMELQAETINARVVKVGNNGGSVFGTDSILETVSANVLRKPFNRAELENLLSDALGINTPQELSSSLVSAFEVDCQDRLNAEMDELDKYYDGLINNVRNDKNILKFPVESSDWYQAISIMEKELAEAKEKKLVNLKKTAFNRQSYLSRLFNFFYVSRSLLYPIGTYTGGRELVPAVFLGVAIDMKKKNPFIPSQIRFRFAIAGSTKYLVLPASMSAQLFEIIGASSDMDQPVSRITLLDSWSEYIKQSIVDRKIRHIITGNLLQAFSSFKGKLVSYTTMNGKTLKGILMPEHWNPGEEIADKVTVPILKSLSIIRSLVNGGQFTTDNGISFFKKSNRFRVVVSGSRQRAGDIFLDKDLLALVDGNNFEKVANNMSAWVEEESINDFVNILDAKHRVSVTLNGAQYRQIEQVDIAKAGRNKILLPPSVDEIKEQQANQHQEDTTIIVRRKTVRIRELEAKALLIKLKLISYTRRTA